MNYSTTLAIPLPPAPRTARLSHCYFQPPQDDPPPQEADDDDDDDDDERSLLALIMRRLRQIESLLN